MEIGQKLGFNLSSCLDLLERFYGVQEPTLYEAIQKNPAYKTGKAPTTLNYRYIYEDIPYGLIPMAALGEKLGVNMDCSNLLVDLASCVMDEVLRKHALLLEDLVIRGMDGEEMVGYLRGGGFSIIWISE